MILKVLNDFVAFSYAVVIMLCLWGFVMFFWWWRKIGKATEVYLYIMSLFGSMVFAIGGALHGRIYTITNQHESFHSLVNSFLWRVRMVPVAIVIALIVFRMSQRVYLNIKASRRLRNGGRNKNVQNNGSRR